MLKNFQLATKLYLSFGGIALIALFLGIFGYYGAEKNQQSIDEIGIVRLPSVEALLIISVSQTAVDSAENALLSTHLDIKEREAQYQRAIEAKKRAEDAWKIYEPLPQTVEEAAVWKEFVPAWKKWMQDHEAYLALTEKYDSLIEFYSKQPLAEKMSYADALANAVTLAKDIRITLGVQVQEWKNILLRGADKAMYDRYLAAFEKAGNEVQAKLSECGKLIRQLGLDESSVTKLLGDHAALDKRYRDALTRFDRNDPLAGHRVDTEVRGADRPVAEGMQQVADTLASAEKMFDGVLDQTFHQALVTNAESFTGAETLLLQLVEINHEVAEHEVERAHHFAARLKAILLIAAITGTLLAVLIAFLITRAITRPLANAVAVCEELSRGNLAVDIKVGSKDETGQLLAAMKTMVASQHSMFTDITNGVATLSSSSTELSAVATQLSSNAEDASSRSTSVASAAEEMTTNMSSVSAAMEQSASNVGMVATATEEMTSTVREIAQNAAKAKDISEQAVNQSQQASSKMNDLGQAADKIGKVTEAITEISEQTNLLALNATIEAARAGEAGKGFAVVANEIKELAKQTAAATVDIKNQIEEMQRTTGGAITDIDKIGRVITEINEIVTTIATAVEQQSAATSEISENIAQASAGIAEVNENVAQSTVAITDITKDISEINSSSGEVSNGSHNVKESATELSHLAELLDGLVRRFKLA